MNISSENYGQMLSIIYESIGQGEQIANNKIKDSFCKIKDEFNQFRIGADVVHIVDDRKVGLIFNFLEYFIDWAIDLLECYGLVLRPSMYREKEQSQKHQ